VARSIRENAQAVNLRVKDAPTQVAPGARRGRQNAIAALVQGGCLAVKCVDQRHAHLPRPGVPDFERAIASARDNADPIWGKATGHYRTGMASEGTQAVATTHVPGFERVIGSMLF
jgi:hypothetical protein